VGGLFLLQEFGLLGNAADLLWMLMIAAGAGVFLYIYLTQPDQWWAVIPGMTLLGLTLIFLEDLLNLNWVIDFGGAVFLGCIGLAFWLVFLRNQDFWWAIIPGGVLLTLAVVAGLDSLAGWTEVIFFLGLAGTFFMVAIVPGKNHDTRWAYIPAISLAVLGLVLFSPVMAILLKGWPLVLVGVGIYILLRNWI
jgi:hypothetical protein